MTNTKNGFQAQTFLSSEGDKWFERNLLHNDTSEYYDLEMICRTLSAYKNDIHNILEVGCGNGHKLNLFSEKMEARASGIDPSNKAIDDGLDKFPEMDLKVATANDLPFVNQEFDMLMFGFSLYLVDRDDLYKTIAEADRVLKPGGFLSIVDFDPATRHKRPYHHYPGIYSYKTQYADFFTVGGHYHLVSKLSYSHSGDSFVNDVDERVSVCVLYKEPDAYPEKTSL